MRATSRSFLHTHPMPVRWDNANLLSRGCSERGANLYETLSLRQISDQALLIYISY